MTQPDKLMRHLNTPALHRYFWQCAGAVIAGHYLYSGIKMLILGMLYG